MNETLSSEKYKINWNKIELYDDLYPWAIQSENGHWIIAKDVYGNSVLFCKAHGRRKIIKKIKISDYSSRAIDLLKLHAEMSS